MEADDIIQARTGAAGLGGLTRQCTATAKTTGERCTRHALIGGFVCGFHGGNAPQVQAARRERLLAMADPAIAALQRALEPHGAPCEHCGRSEGDRDPNVIRAAQIVLDRCGFSPAMKLEVSAPNPYADMTLSEIAEQAEYVAREARAAAKAEAQLRLGDGMTVDGVVITEER
jgi:hypothetical protein